MGLRGLAVWGFGVMVWGFRGLGVKGFGLGSVMKSFGVLTNASYGVIQNAQSTKP